MRVPNCTFNDPYDYSSTNEHSQYLDVTGNVIVLWTRFKGFDSLNLRKAAFPIGETEERQEDLK
ncbi:hypothetical protein AUI06_02530 [archaeon 13_2_20CM_2_52_21]|nr:MAG: hypothetical protein AUI06_02530 [archaeon 13_2_20CM_2_52_21]